MKYVPFVLLGVALASVELRSQTVTPLPPKPEPISSTNDDIRGTVGDDGAYSNAFFGLSLRVPKSFSLLNKGEAEIYTKAGNDILKGNDPKNDKALDAALNRSIALLMVAIKPPGSVGNAILEMHAVKQPTGVTANMVLGVNTKLLTGTGKSVVVGRLKDKVVGGQNFVGAEFNTTVNGQSLRHKIFFTIVRGYSISLGLTFTENSPDHMAVFDGMLDTVTFAKR